MTAIALGLIVVAITALAAWYLLQLPLYRPGAARAASLAGGGRPLAGPDQPAGDWTTARGSRLHHWASGSGRPVLVVHGGPGQPFRRPLPGLAQAEARFRFHYYDQRGCGRSPWPFVPAASRGRFANMKALENELGLAAQISDIEGARVRLGEERLILVGHSFGAFLAALYAAEWPERVAGLVLVAPADLLLFPPPDGDLLARVKGLLPESRRAEYAAFLAEYLDFRRLFQRTDAETAALNARFAVFYTEAARASGFQPPAEGATEGAGFMVQAQYLSMGRRHDYRAALRAVGSPALVVHGSRDLQPEAASRRYVDALADARLVTIEGAGHWPYEEQPRRFAEAVTPFLDGLR
jgi:proline iminopeptidase